MTDSLPLLDTNPLLDATALPRFDAIRPEHVTPAVDVLLADADTALAHATSDAVPADYEALSAVLDVATERLARAWAAVGHLNAVLSTPELRAAYNDNLSRVVEFHTRLGADERLFAKYKAVLASPAAVRLSASRRKALDNAVRDFRLSGAELKGAGRARYAELQDAQAEHGQKFSENTLDATDAFADYATEAEVDGLPADVRETARAGAEADGRPGYKLTLKYPCYLPVLDYATDRGLRKRLYTAFATRASEFGPPALDNTALIGELLALRFEEARLLGYANPAEQSLVSKMAETPEQVVDFLTDLARRARPGAERDLAELEDFAFRELGLDALQAWDRPFASTLLKERRYAFSEQDVKQYFTEPKVLEGLFRIVETVFEVRIRPDVAPVWHPDVRFFRIERPAAGTEPQLVGQFYLDAYARAGKQSGAWMDDVRDRWLRPDGQLQTPVAHLVCNFAPPTTIDGRVRPSLLTHDDVVTLFHEFGHGLQLMLTRVDDLGVSGISGVEWDAVELPSQFMENFCWEWDVLEHLTAHVDTGKPMPRELFDRMLAAKNFQTGLQTLRQVELALVDMRLHMDPTAADDVRAVAEAVRAEVAVVAAPPFARPLNTFTHVFDGGYAAGYYSYKWAEVLSADAWSAFEDAGVLSVDCGRRFREHVLETGGSRSALDNFVSYRGREPRIDALLRHSGLSA